MSESVLLNLEDRDTDKCLTCAGQLFDFRQITQEQESIRRGFGFVFSEATVNVQRIYLAIYRMWMVILLIHSSAVAIMIIMIIIVVDDNDDVMFMLESEQVLFS